MKKLLLILITGILTLVLPEAAIAQPQRQLVQLVKLQIHAPHLESFKAALRAQIEASIRVEPGVQSLYAVSEKENLSHITIIETYVDSVFYKAHLKSPHYKKYKALTRGMVKSHELVEAIPIFIQQSRRADTIQDKNLVVHLVKLQIDSSQRKSYSAALRERHGMTAANTIEELRAEIESGKMRRRIIEPGNLTTYAVYEKANPTHITFLEIYASTNAYKAHLENPDYIKYQTDTKDMVKSVELVQTNPILLGTHVKF